MKGGGRSNRFLFAWILKFSGIFRVVAFPLFGFVDATCCEHGCPNLTSKILSRCPDGQSRVQLQISFSLMRFTAKSILNSSLIFLQILKIREDSKFLRDLLGLAQVPPLAAAAATSSSSSAAKAEVPAACAGAAPEQAADAILDDVDFGAFAW